MHFMLGTPANPERQRWNMTRSLRLARTLVLILLALLIAACGEQVLAPLDRNATILAFGDSLTYGTGVGGAEQNASYPSVLARLSGREVINAGVPGEKTSEGKERLPEALEYHDPDLLILIEGGNDILRNRRHEAIKADLKVMIQTAEQASVPVVLIGVPEKKLFSSSAPFYAELAEEHGLVFDGELIGDLMRSPSMKSDPIHFNQAGYRAMAESVYTLLQDQGALE